MHIAALRRLRDSITPDQFDDEDEGKRAARAATARRIFDRLINLPLSEDLVAANDAGPSARADSQTLPLFARQLEQVMTEVEREVFSELEMANGTLLPIDTSVDEGAKTFVYYVYSSAGVARFLAGYASNEIPIVSLSAAEVTGHVQPYGIGYAYTTQDIRHSQFARYPLNNEQALAARRGADQLLDSTGKWGREDLGLPGLFNHPNITVATPGTSAGAGDDTWPNKTVDEIIADVVSLIDGVEELTFGQEKVNRVLISRVRFNLIKTLRMGAGDGTLTVLKYLREMYPGVDFRPSDDMAGDNSEGNLGAGTHSMFAYTAGDRRKASLIVPMLFKQHPVQQVDLKFKVPCEASTGGVKMPRPLMCARMDGI